MERNDSGLEDTQENTESSKNQEENTRDSNIESATEESDTDTEIWTTASDDNPVENTPDHVSSSVQSVTRSCGTQVENDDRNKLFKFLVSKVPQKRRKIAQKAVQLYKEGEG